MAQDALIAARAEALFASDISNQCHPDKSEVAAAIRSAVRAHAGVCGCAGEVAAAYGECPETAAARMRWARQVIETIYSSTGVPAAVADARQPGDLEQARDEVPGQVAGAVCQGHGHPGR